MERPLSHFMHVFNALSVTWHMTQDPQLPPLPLITWQVSHNH